MHGNATLSIAIDSVAVSMLHSMGQGFSVFFSVLSSDDNETEIPSFTNAAACLRLAGVIRLSVPSSSSFPHRPQLESSFCQRSYSAFVTSGCVAFCCAAAIAAIRINKENLTREPPLLKQGVDFSRRFRGWHVFNRCILHTS